MKGVIEDMSSKLQFLLDALVWFSTTPPLTHEAVPPPLQYAVALLVHVTLDVVEEEGVLDQLETLPAPVPFTYQPE